MVNINDAAGAYTNALKQLQGSETDKTAAQKAAGGPSFGAVLEESIKTSIDAQHKSEQTAAKAVIGKADMTEVLQAVNDAEIALNTVLAVRDRVVQAYETVMRTPI